MTQQDVVNGLTGEGNFLTIQQQLGLDPSYWDATTAAAQEALVPVPDETTEKGGRWGSVRQGPSKPYGTFVDRLYTTPKRQVQDEAAQEVIVRQLAFDNANEDCKQVLRPLLTTPNVAKEKIQEDLNVTMMQEELTVAKEKIQRTLPITYLGMDLVAKGRRRALALTGMDLRTVYLPFSQEEVNHLMAATHAQIAFADFVGHIFNNPPKDPRLSFLTGLRYVLDSSFSPLPLPSALTVFTGWYQDSGGGGVGGGGCLA